MTEDKVSRRLMALLSADVVGYSRLMGADEAATVRTLDEYKGAMSALIRQHRGRVVDAPGDNLLAEFASVVDAVQCAVAVQRELTARAAETPESCRMRFRIGINVGDVIVDGERVYGDGVNVAARVEGLADGGGICLSGAAFDQVEGKLALEFEDLGEQSVKNIRKPVRAYRVKLDGPLGQVAPRPEGPSPQKPSIAVLPFVNMSGDPDQEYFSDGIAEDLITALSRFRWFFVIARNSSFTYKGKAVDVKDVASALRVRYVLEGSVRKAGNRVRITAQLIDAPTGHHVWAERYDRDLSDIFTVQDEITERIVTSVGPEFLSAEMQRARRKDARSLDAWDYLMRAAFHHSRYSAAEVAEAQRLLRRAIELDPLNADSFSLLAFTHLTQTQFGWVDSAEESIREAEKAAQRAVAIDDRDAWPHTALGLVDLISRRYEDAVRRLERAVELNVNLANAYGALGQALALAGEYEAAVTQINKAVSLSPHDPFSVYWFGHLGLAAFADERYDEACAWAARAVRENPQFPGGHRLLAASYGQCGRLEEADGELEELLRLMPGMTPEDVRRQVPFKQPRDMERYIEGLRKAGLA